jgi:predicted nucleic acid-binding protein
MAVSPRPHIVDASVLIDLEHGGLIEELFLLRHGWTAPDVVILEVLEPLGSMLTGYGLKISHLRPEDIQEVARLREIHKGVSANDLFCLVLAKTHRGTLITGDMPLRKAAEGEEVKVRGTLWILDELVVNKIIPGGRAAEALERMKKSGGRFPPEEVTRRLNRWRGKT